MIYKVGQRVKRVKTGPSGGLYELPLGSVGTITHDAGGAFVAVDWDNHPDLNSPDAGWCRYSLAPLTDPLAEQFIQSVKSWGPLEKEDLPAEDLERVRSAG